MKTPTIAMFTLIATLLFCPLGRMAQDGTEPATGSGAVAQPKPPIELGSPFADNAILQREMDLPVWGWSKPGTKITVQFSGQQQTAETGKDGKWMVKLAPLKASDKPAEMVISDSEGKKVTLNNVLVGEVWMASGQSNMQWLAGQCDVAKIIGVLAAKGEHPPIREFGISSVYSALHPIEHATGGWKDGDYGSYSAIAFAFANKLHQELKVPIGILNCSFSQTSIQAWTPRVGFRDGKDYYTQAIHRTILESDPTTPEHKAAWGKFYQDAEHTITRNAGLVKNGKVAEAVSTKTPGNLNDNRDASWMYNAKLHPVVPYAIRGAIWNQGYANISEGFEYYNNLHSLIRGWREVWGQGDFPVYFHQFYAPGANNGLTLNPMAEMRLGAWQARDIPHTGMACQIDITGAIHYRDKALPGKRLALHALKNQYGKKIAADGPMFKSYEVKGDKLIVTFDFADGGLLVGRTTQNDAIDAPVVIENGEDKVTLFYLADKDRIWHRARLKVEGERAVLAAMGVANPRGVAYAYNGAGSLPNLYNSALLPMAPFIYYDHKLVTSKDWLDDPIKVEGVKVDLASVGRPYEYRKMPLLSSQFRDNAVLQAGMPVVIWGSAVHDWGYEAKGKAEIKFSFAGIEKTIPVTHGMKEWQVMVPPMQASAEPKTLKVTFTVDGEIVHERVAANIVVGDVWYIAAPVAQAVGKGGNGAVRVMTRKAMGFIAPNPRRYSVCVSTTPGNTFDSVWTNADGGLAGLLGDRIYAKTGKPVGIIFMQGEAPELKCWIGADDLKQAPSLMEDYKQLGGLKPGNLFYDANIRRYIADWKKYWSEYIPPMIADKRVPDGQAWGIYPTLSGGSITTKAAQSYNVMVHSFWPGSFKGIVFLCSQKMFKADQGAHFGEQLSVLANSWKDKFGCPDPHFFYTIPTKKLAPKITKPASIKGASTALEIDQWLNGEQIPGLFDTTVTKAYN